MNSGTFATGINSGFDFNYWKDDAITIPANGLNQYFKLDANIDLSSVCDSTEESEVSWTPIGNKSGSIPFSGHFNGAGHTISNLYINQTSNYQGLFGYIYEASIDSLILADARIYSKEGTGGICGYAFSSEINQVSNINGSIIGVDRNGGICGIAESTKITDALNSSNISGRFNIGGICGEAKTSSEVRHAYNKGNIIAEYITANSIGGICGYASSSLIINSVNNGSIFANGSNSGGICGTTEETTVNYNVNNGSIVGYNSVGGICGILTDSTSNYNLNSGNVSGNENVGGIIGDSYLEESTISYNINTGNIIGTKSIGSISGSDLITATANYNDKQMCTQGGIVGNDISTSATSRLTIDLTGIYLKSSEGFTDDNFVFTDKMYPLPKGIKETEATIAAITPIFLSSKGTFETVKKVASNFTVGIKNNVTWTSSEEKIDFSKDGNARILSSGDDSLFASINGTIYKRIGISISNEMGSALNPFIINSVSDLQALATGINSGTSFTYWGDNTKSIPAGGSNSTFKLNSDLDLSSVCGSDIDGAKVNWTPIGNGTTFNGKFNGDGHTIYNLYFNDTTSSSIGLFGSIDGARIENLNLVGTDITGKETLGGLFGYAVSSSISHCTNHGKINAVFDAGGIGGHLNSSYISHCTNYATINTNRSSGGICGYVYQTDISYCINNGTINGSFSIAGITGGLIQASSISYSINNGDINGGSGSGFDFGGICATIQESSISYCVNSGTVKGDEMVSGISAGQEKSNISYCINSGLVKRSHSVGSISALSSGNFKNNYFDKQMSNIGGIADTNKINKAEGFLTTEMTGDALKKGESGEGWTDDNFVFTSGMYPRPKGIETTDGAIIAATPIFLQSEETIDEISNKFTVGTENGVSWDITVGKVTLSDGIASIEDSGNDTLICTLGTISKRIPIALYKAPWNGDGTKESPYLITSVKDLQQLASDVNNKKSFKDKYFLLTADLDLSNVCGKELKEGEVSWTPIGNKSESIPFSGHFNGAGHTISNLYINQTSNYQGLFGYIYEASIDSLKLVNTDITGQIFIGSICGYAVLSTISYCSNNGSIKGFEATGGICGLAGGSDIKYNSNGGNVNGDVNIGGICGLAEMSDIKYNSNSGNVNGNEDIGGICGELYDSYISFNSNSGNVGDGDYVGGICGYAEESDIAYNINTNKVSGSSNTGSISGSIYNTTFTENYYDKQMSSVSAVGESDTKIKEGNLLTSQMTGNALKESESGEGWTKDNFVFTSGMYPRPMGIETTDVAIVAATPIFLASSDSSIASITTGFSIGTKNDVVWKSVLGNAKISEANVILKKIGVDTLVCTLGSARKTIAITIDDLIVNAVRPQIASAFTLYRIPNSDYILISGLNQNSATSLQIYDISGKMVLSKQLNKVASEMVNVSTLAHGIYHLRVGNQMLKLIMK